MSSVDEFISLKYLSQDFMHLFDEASSSFADVVFKCESCTVPAHKNILSARSPVFSAMFKNDMRESREKIVDISDISISTLRIMLVYIYTGKTDINMSNVQELMFAADKYQLTRLKEACTTYLKSCANDQNILNLLMLGDIYEQDLKNFAICFISNQVTEFSILENTEDWKRLQTENITLAMEVLISLVKAKDKKLKDLTCVNQSSFRKTNLHCHPVFLN